MLNNQFDISVSILIFSIFVCLLLVFCPNPEEDFSGLPKENDITLVEKIFNRLYFGILLATTNGYSEIRPKSKKCHYIVIVFLILLFLEFLNIITKYHYFISK